MVLSLSIHPFVSSLLNRSSASQPVDYSTNEKPGGVLNYTHETSAFKWVFVTSPNTALALFINISMPCCSVCVVMLCGSRCIKIETRFDNLLICSLSDIDS